MGVLIIETHRCRGSRVALSWHGVARFISFESVARTTYARLDSRLSDRFLGIIYINLELGGGSRRGAASYERDCVRLSAVQSRLLAQKRFSDAPFQTSNQPQRQSQASIVKGRRSSSPWIASRSEHVTSPWLHCNRWVQDPELNLPLLSFTSAASMRLSNAAVRTQPCPKCEAGPPAESRGWGKLPVRRYLGISHDSWPRCRLNAGKPRTPFKHAG
jgi:hypothetical protein